MAKAGRPKLEKNMTEFEKFERLWNSLGNDRRHSIMAVLASGTKIIGKARRFESPAVDDIAKLDEAVSLMARSFGLHK